MVRNSETLSIALAASLGVLIAAGAYIIIPLPFSPIPVTAQTFFVLLAGLLLGSRWGAVAVSTYLIIGIAGFPVFSGGTGGIGILLGPTGGYLIGFLIAALTVGYISRYGLGRKPKMRRGLSAISVFVGTAIIYLFGIPWLSLIADLSLKEAIITGLVPFIPGDILKSVGAILVAESVWSTASLEPIQSVRR